MITYLTHRSAGRRVWAVAAAGILLAALLPASGSTNGFQTANITIRHSRFVPAHFTVRRGATVRFVIINADPIDHEFILGDKVVQHRHETGTEPEHGAIPGEVSIRAGDVGETTYTFNRPGLLLIGCHAPGHYAYGMRGWVRILD